MQTIQTKITEKYGRDVWRLIKGYVQDIARGEVTISDIQKLTGLTEWQSRSTADTIREFIYVPENKIRDISNGSFQKWLILPDVHRPFHNKVLWDKILQLIYDLGSSLYGLIWLGDYLDAETISRFNQGSVGLLKDRTLGQEYDEGSEGLDQVDEALHEGAKKVFMYGNHEDRFRRLVLSGDNAKYGSALKTPTEGLRLRERGYDVYDRYGEDFYLLGDHLEAMHGDYTNKYASEKHLRLGGGSYIFGHAHIVQSYHNGESASFCIGWLGDKDNPMFRYTSRLARSKWSNGFAIVHIDDQGFYYVDQITVWGNSFFVNNKKY